MVTLCVGCDSPSDAERCRGTISPNLQRIMYWGSVSGGHWEPNQGYEIGAIRRPVWYRADRILVRTGRVANGEVVAGIFEVEIDSGTREFQAIRSYTFPYFIHDYDFDGATGDFALTFSATPSDIQTVRASVAGSDLVVVDTLLSDAWRPRAARYAENGDVIAYATDPATVVDGFYLLSSLGFGSLLCEVVLPASDARGFDVAGGRLCYGRTDLVTDKSQLMVVDLAGDTTPRMVAQFDGMFVSVGMDPSGARAVVSVENLPPFEPGSVVRLVDLETGASARLDVRTHLCGFVTADFASWNPAGNAFAFSASGFDFEGSEYPRSLWVRKNVNGR